MPDSPSTIPVLVAPGELRAGLMALLQTDETPHQVLLSAPGLVTPSVDDIAVTRKPWAILPLQRASEHRSAILRYFRSDIDQLPQTAEWESRIASWLHCIEQDQLAFRYWARAPLFSRMLSRTDATLTLSGPIHDRLDEISHELRVELHGSEHARAREWFRSRYDEAQDVTGEVAESLRNSWAGSLISPQDAYYKTLAEYFSGVLSSLDEDVDRNPMLDQLTEFQRDAYHYAKSMLLRYGGAFLADVVGLGKTFIALALLNYLQRRTKPEHAVVIAPPKVLPVWEELAREFGVDFALVSSGKLDDLDRYPERQILVIDESHNFRNTGTGRYQRLNKWLRPNGMPSERKVLLLSATPQNNDMLDIKHQLALFPEGYMRLPFQAESLDDWFNTVRSEPARLNELLQHVLVRRTRGYIKQNYADATLRKRVAPGEYEEVGIHFPTRISGPDQCLRYSLAATYQDNIYDRIIEILAQLKYPLHGLGGYVLEQHVDDPRVRGIRKAGSSVRGLFKILLLKRMESSVYAFRLSLESLSTRLQQALRELDSGIVRLKRTIKETEDDDDAAFVEVDGEAPSSFFNQLALRKDLTSDISDVRSLLNAVDGIRASNDAKLRALQTYLANRPPSSHKTLLFTQFSDTVDYLRDALGTTHGRTEAVSGSTGNALQMARRFAPVANKREVPPGEQIDFLITTDVLSEGVNLQDADTLINYDLHWNPVRLIQRAGRIDRIGSEHAEIHVASFLPELALEAGLRLEEVLRRRIREFIQVFGEDSDVLPGHARPSEELMTSAYTGIAFVDDAEDPLDGLSQHSDRILRLRRVDPEHYNYVYNIRNGRRAASTAGAPGIVVSRLTWLHRFWKTQGEDVTEVEPLEALNTLYEHSVAERRELVAGELIQQLACMSAAREKFQSIADTFKQQRLEPRLIPAARYVLSQLEGYKLTCLESRKLAVAELIQKVRQGQAQMALNRLAAAWKKQQWTQEMVFDACRELFSRQAQAGEYLGEPELLVGCFGKCGDE